MLREIIAGAWRRIPRKLRQWLVRRAHVRFTVTAAAVIVNGEGRVLLLKHAFRPGTGWGLPGGFINAGEQPEQALQRELREEVGLELCEINLIKVRTFGRAKQVEIAFHCRAKGEPRPRGAEVTKAGWFSIDDLPAGLPKDQRRMIAETLSDGANSVDDVSCAAKNNSDE